MEYMIDFYFININEINAFRNHTFSKIKNWNTKLVVQQAHRACAKAGSEVKQVRNYLLFLLQGGQVRSY